MASIFPNEAEERALTALYANGEDFFCGLFANLPAALDVIGRENLVFADLTLITNVTPSSSGAPNGAAVGAEWRMDALDWTIPTGAQAGNDASHPQIEFLAGVGGASAAASGYYVRNGSNVLVFLNTHPTVESTGTALAMNVEGAIYRANPAPGAE